MVGGCINKGKCNHCAFGEHKVMEGHLLGVECGHPGCFEEAKSSKCLVVDILGLSLMLFG